MDDVRDNTMRSARPYQRLGLSVLVLTWGVQAIVTQSLLLREALVLMFGSEFAWGVVLFAWLFGVSAGAALGGWTAERLPRPDVVLVAVLLALAATTCVELWVFRGARAWLGVERGELLPLPGTALAALLFVAPVSALVGLAFPLACCLAPRNRGGNFSAKCAGTRGGQVDTPYASFGGVYAVEAAGSLIGGALFSFWLVESFSPIQTALLAGAVTTAAGAAFLATSRQTMLAPGALGAVAVTVVCVAVFAGQTLNERLVQLRWNNVAPGYELVAEAESRYQNLAIGQRAGQYTLYCDGKVAVDFPDPYTFAPLAHFWLCQHPAPRNVLILGGGAEGLLAEILRHPVAHVDYVEPDPRQITLVTSFLEEHDQDALRDPRVTVHLSDARYYIKTQRRRFDLVLARLPEPTAALHARFYTDEFYGELRRALTPRAVFCCTVTAAPGELSAAARDYVASVRATLARHFPYITIGWGDPAQVLAATDTGLVSVDPAVLAERYEQRGVQSQYFVPAWFDHATDWLEPDKLALRAADLAHAADVQISTDLWPAIYLQRLVLWEALMSAGGPARKPAAVFATLRSIRLTTLIVILAACGGVTLLAGRLRRHTPNGWTSGAIALSIGTTGFVTMALSIVWLFAFQNLYGYVYQRIGWIIALFMGGLVIGCAVSNWRLTRLGVAAAPTRLAYRRLIGVDVLLAVLAVALPFVLPALGALQSGPGTFLLVELCVSLMVVLTGLLGGAAFPLATHLQLGACRRIGATAGSVDAADHAGACLGALLCGILLVPVFGTATTALLLAGMKCASAIVLAITCRAGRAF